MAFASSWQRKRAVCGFYPCYLVAVLAAHSLFKHARATITNLMEMTRPDQTRPDYWGDACAYLSAQDDVMARIIASHDGCLESRGEAFYSLLRSIVGQQISVKAADSVWHKLETVAGELSPTRIIALSEEELRTAGLSRQKITYMKSLAEHFVSGAIDPTHFHEMDDEAVIAVLTDVKGIGRWTAEMFLMFHLLRPNVFSVQDLGLLKAVERHYGIPMVQKPTKEKRAYEGRVLALAENWSPYKTVASWYLWRSLDPVSVAY